jgi:hypothetical protein
MIKDDSGEHFSPELSSYFLHPSFFSVLIWLLLCNSDLTILKFHELLKFQNCLTVKAFVLFSASLLAELKYYYHYFVLKTFYYPNKFKPLNHQKKKENKTTLNFL